jgi:uncharacterized protein YgbK (DUF1537 family)
LEGINVQRISIIADDLTGASDSGVQFARKGLKTQVIFDWKSLSAEAVDLDAIVIDTDSRSTPGDVAYQRVKSAAEALKQKGFTWVYKKMDSTLRGNFAQEISAVMDAYGFEAAFIAPAFPRIGRTTVNGIHYLNGTPIHETEMARDPKTPVPESEIVQIIARQSGKESISIPLALLRKGLEAVRHEIRENLNRQVKLFVFDAESDEDLQRIAELTSIFGTHVLWVGSAGLAEFLLIDDSQGRAHRESFHNPVEGQVMLVAGSISKVTREQVMEASGAPNVTAVEMNPLAALGSAEERAQEIERCSSVLISALNSGSDLSLFSGSSAEQVSAAKEKGARLGLDSSDVSNQIADMLGEISGKFVSDYVVKGLVLTGGDTAKAVCRHLGVHGFELLNEVEPGIPHGRLLGDISLMAVTKAGAFGTKQSLLRAMQYLKQGKEVQIDE